ADEGLVLLRPGAAAVGGPDHRGWAGAALGQPAVQRHQQVAVVELDDRAVGGGVAGVVGADDDVGRTGHRGADLDRFAPAGTAVGGADAVGAVQGRRAGRVAGPVGAEEVHQQRAVTQLGDLGVAVVDLGVDRDLGLGPGAAVVAAAHQHDPAVL